MDGDRGRKKNTIGMVQKTPLPREGSLVTIALLVPHRTHGEAKVTVR